MGRISAYTEETMKEAVAMLEEKTGREVAEFFEVSLPTIYNWKKKMEGGEAKARRRKAKANGHADEADVLPLVPGRNGHHETRPSGLGAQVTALETENAQLRAALAKLKDAFVGLAGENLAS